MEFWKDMLLARNLAFALYIAIWNRLSTLRVVIVRDVANELVLSILTEIRIVFYNMNGEKDENSQ